MGLIAAHVALIGLYVASRTVDLPFLAPMGTGTRRSGGGAWCRRQRDPGLPRRSRGARGSPGPGLRRSRGRAGGAAARPGPGHLAAGHAERPRARRHRGGGAATPGVTGGRPAEAPRTRMPPRRFRGRMPPDRGWGPRPTGGNTVPDTVPAGRRRVVVVDDHRTFAELLTMGLEAHPRLTCVGSANDARSALSLVAREQPDVVVMDIRLGAESGVEVTAQLIERWPHTAVVVLTAFPTPSLMSDVVRAGASALLPKDGALDDLLDTVLSAQPRLFTMPPRLAETMMRPRDDDPVSPSPRGRRTCCSSWRWGVTCGHQPRARDLGQHLPELREVRPREAGRPLPARGRRGRPRARAPRHRPTR